MTVRLTVLLVACVVLAGCAPSGSSGGDGGGPGTEGDRTVDVRGTITRTAASTGPDGWILETDDGILLALALPDDPAADANCVTIAVDDDFPDVSREDEVIAALQQVSEQTGEALTVTGFC